MHKLSSTPITLDCFETDDYNRDLILFNETYNDEVISFAVDDFSRELIDTLEQLRIKYNETKDQKYWKELVRWLPNGWLQTRTVTMNFFVLISLLVHITKTLISHDSIHDDNNISGIHNIVAIDISSAKLEVTR